MSLSYCVQTHARAVRLRPWRKTALAFALALPLLAAAAPLPLTFNEALRQAVARSRQLPAQDQAVTAAQQMAIAVGQRPDPVIKAGIDNLPLSGHDRFNLNSDAMTMRRIGIAQELTSTDKLHWRAVRQEREAGKAQAQKQVALAAIERETAIAWLNVYYNRKVATVLAKQLELSRQEIDAAEAAYRGGRGSQADLLAARAALFVLEDRGSQSRRDLDVAANALARWTGYESELAESDLPDLDNIGLDPAILDAQSARRPQIAVLARQEEAAQADVHLAQANRHADWSVEVAFQQRGSAYGNMLSVGLSLPMQWDRPQRQDRDLAAKLALAEQAKDEREEAMRDDAATTHALLIAWKNGRERTERYTRQLLPVLEQRSEAALAAYRGGKGTLADVLAARRGTMDARIELVRLQMDTAQRWAQLRFLFPDTQQDLEHPQ